MDGSVPYDFGRYLQQARRNARLSQQQAARKLELASSSISAYECGIKSPKVSTLRRMALIYRVSLDELMGIKAPSSLSVEGLSKDQKKFYPISSTILKTTGNKSIHSNSTEKGGGLS